jgi:trk system potassium uptake protein TrkA
MKIIICGAGQVGSNIARYLSEEGVDVTIIDRDPEVVAELSNKYDVSGVVGFASHPDILEKAGAKDAEMLIASTQYDEVNMVACQVAHSVFNVPKTAARIREQTYLDAAWADMFSREHVPIDIVISPEIEIAKTIANRLRVPGAFNLINLADGLVQLVSVICNAHCPLLNTPLKHLTTLFPHLEIQVVAIIRGDEKIIPDSSEQIYEGDEVYFITASKHLMRSLAAFGHTEPESRKIIIVGAGKIGIRLAQELKKTLPGITIKMIEINPRAAEHAANILGDVVVLNGDSLKEEMLQEANINVTETIITVTNNDESNILISLLGKQYGCERAIALVNNNEYIQLVSNLGIDAVINPKAITVSTILQYIRRGKIKSAYAVRDGFAEILEIEALDTSAIVHKAIADIDIPETMIIGAVIRRDEIIIPRPDTTIKHGDRVIILAAHDIIKDVEQMFSVRPEFF